MMTSAPTFPREKPLSAEPSLQIQVESNVDSGSIMSRFSEQGAQLGLGLRGHLHVEALLQRVHIPTCS